MKTIGVVSVIAVLFLFNSALSREFSPLPPSGKVGDYPKAQVPFDLAGLKTKWRSRIASIKTAGIVPIIDIESSFNPGKMDAREFAKQMDENGVALVAFSPEVGEGEYRKNSTVWSDASRRAVNMDPWRYIPVTTAGIHPAWTENPEEFLNTTIRQADADRYPLLGEFEFRHYPSPRQYQRKEMYRDVSIPITSNLGARLFEYAERSGIPFEIHYEVEDALLPPLEEMLSRYPKAKIIWCHLGQVRYGDRAKKYSPGYVRDLMTKYPNLYFDLAFGGPHSIYPGSNEYHARVWDRSTRGVKKEWVDLISDYPWRFLAALDLGGDRMGDLPDDVKTLRRFLESLPRSVEEIVAYKASWKLLFDEEI